MNGVHFHDQEKEAINGQELLAWFEHALEVLRSRKQEIDALNVFPVPDGDTGTNMYLTFSSGVKEALSHTDRHVGRLVKTLSRGLLMGARGNSGVILSQLFRGFSLYLENKAELTPSDLAYALKRGVETAYAAVIKPVEGTILTVAREAAEKTVEIVEKKRSACTFTLLFNTWLDQARTTLKRTPDYLPVLKQAGVVDAGGFGLIVIMEGLSQAIQKQPVSEHDQKTITAQAHPTQSTNDPFLEEAHAALDIPVQVGMDPRDITYGYCTEFIVRLDPSLISTFDEKRFREKMERFGDSLLVARDQDLVKLHVHTERPGEAMTYVQSFGEIIRIKIDNMREQLREVNRTYAEKKKTGNMTTDAGMTQAEMTDAEMTDTEKTDAKMTDAKMTNTGLSDAGTMEAKTVHGMLPDNKMPHSQDDEMIQHKHAEDRTEGEEGHPVLSQASEAFHPPSPYGFVAVVQGEGMRRIFESLGVRAVITGGQTMNPSTEEMLAAIKKLPDDTIFILPNNKNVVLAAKQAKQLSDRSVEVIETTSMPEGIAALIAFVPDEDVETNIQRMRRAAQELKVAQFTQAIREARHDENVIREGDWLGIYGGNIVSNAASFEEVVQKTLSLVVAPDRDVLLTLYWGETAAPAARERIIHMIEETYPELEIDVQDGGQPLYPLIVSVE
ncbi:MAG: DAK2 domain-containing protein [Candidatus Carbobacillus altaicus]|nr:DAK2 domain-containing protein [Candidatus Carbobacillus altaicus]